MVEHNDFEDIIKNLTNKNTLNRVKSISDECIRIFRIDKETRIINLC